MHNTAMKCDGAVRLIDKVLLDLKSREKFEVRGVNLLLPFDASSDLKFLLCPLLEELKLYLYSPAHKPLEFEFLFTQKFKALVNLKIFVPDDLLTDLLNLFYALLFENATETPHHLKVAIAQTFSQFLKKGKSLDNKGFEHWNWRCFYELVDLFVYPHLNQIFALHSQQEDSIPTFLECVKRARRHFNLAAFDEVLDEFAANMNPLLAKDYLRSLRYIALLLPTADLAKVQFDRIMTLLHPESTIASSIRTNASVDVFYSYMLRRLAKGNRVLIAGYDWTPWAELVFDHILPPALKIPSPFKGSVKMGKFIPRGEQGNGAKIYECLGENVGVNIAKWIVPCLVESVGIKEKLHFALSSLRNLVHPSNHGSWVGPIESFLMAFTGCLSTMTADGVLQASDLQTVVDLTWSLVEKLVFSKSGTGTTGNFTTCIIGKYLANIDPERIVPKILELVTGSLDSLSEPHRTTSAIGLLCLSMTSVLNFSKTSSGIAPTIMLLPTIAQGIDSNDQIKSIFTFALFSNFATSARIEDLSDCQLSCQESWNDACQMAKEATSQFIDVAILFTEHLIAYLRAYDSGSDNGHAGLDPTIAKLILAVSETFYSQLSGGILNLCLEKWIDYLWTDCSANAADIVGEVLSLAGESNPKLLDDLISKIIGRIGDQIERGSGAMGSLQQGNRKLLCNLTVLQGIFERHEPSVIKNIAQIKNLINLLNQSIGNRLVYDKCCSLISACIISLFHARVEAIKCQASGNPFDSWGKWTRPEDLKLDVDYKWIFPSNEEVSEAFNLLSSQIDWTASKTQQILNGPLDTKAANEGLHCCLLALEFLGDCSQKLLGTFGAQDCGFNGQLSNPEHYEMALGALKRIGAVLVSLMNLFATRNTNVELTAAFANVIGKFIDSRGAHPTRSGVVVNSFSRLGVYLKRHPKDKTRPASHFLKLVMAFRSFRRDYRSILGDSKTESELSPIISSFIDFLFKASFSQYRVIRLRCQTALFHYTSTYPHFANELLERVLAEMETACNDDNITEHLLKGFCFLIQFQLSDLITETPEQFCRFSRLVATLNERADVKSVSDSVSILQAACRRVTEALVPGLHFNCACIKDLTVELIKVAESTSEWTTQMIGLGCVETVVERTEVDTDFVLAVMSLMTSRVRSCRHLANTIFCLISFEQGKRIRPDFWSFRSTSARDILEGSVINRPMELIYSFSSQQKGIFLQLFRQMIFLNSLDDGNESDGPQQLNQHQLFIYSLLIQSFGPQDATELFAVVESVLFPDSMPKMKLDNGKQKTFAEFAVAMIMSAPELSDEWWPKLRGLLLDCWKHLPLEQSAIWTGSPVHPLCWRTEFTSIIQEFFNSSVKSNFAVSIVIALRMISSAVKEMGPLAEQQFVQLTPSELIALFAHEYSLIGTEASRLLAHLQMLQPSSAQASNDKFVLEVHDLAQTCTDSEKPRFYRSLMQFLANCSTAPLLSGYWQLLVGLLGLLIDVLEMDNIQLLADTKKALIALVLAKRCPFDFIQVHLPGAIASSLTRFQAKTRKFLLEILQLCLQNNYTLVNDQSRCKGLLKSFTEAFVNCQLADVREASLGLMVTLYQINPGVAEEDAPVITNALEQLALTIRSEASFATRHSEVIRAAAIVLSEPYTIKTHLPALLSALSRYISDRHPIGSLVKSTFGEFRRTHMETWAADRQLFTDEQLDAIGELLVAPSYYA